MLTDLLLQNEAAFQVVRLTGAALLIGMGAVTLWSAWRGERTRRKEWSRGKGPRRNSGGVLRRVGLRFQGVVPVAVEVVAGDREGVDVFLGVFEADGVLVGVEDAVHP